MDVLPPRADFDRVVALTGAGISVAAGLGTFRGPDGLWAIAPDVERAMHAEYVPENVDLMWLVWGGMHERAQAAGPTPAHRALAAAGVTVITQNVDGLHHTAGSTGAIEIHGSAGRASCLSCDWRGPAGAAVRDPRPRCPSCGELVRPAVVLFGESLDEAARAIGASQDAGALVVNIDPAGGDPGPAFHHQVTGDAQHVLAAWAQTT